VEEKEQSIGERARRPNEKKPSRGGVRQSTSNPSIGRKEEIQKKENEW